MRFERKQRKVVYVASDDIYRATTDKVHASKRRPLDASKHLVGVSTAVLFWDNVDRRDHCLGCARTVHAAWTAGDRYRLDTDDARRAAEIASDLAETQPDDIDICSALVDLMNAIASVSLSETSEKDFDVQNVCSETIAKCYSVPGFGSWSQQSQRRRFMYELPKNTKSDVVYTLMALYFDYGTTPLLTTRQRQELALLDRGTGSAGATLFFDGCLRKMREYRFS